MLRRTSGQSVVEMAFVLPVLLLVLFGIMEFGYYIYAYSSVSQAARNGAEAAAQLPPYASWLTYKTSPPSAADYGGFRSDKCVDAIYRAIESDATLFGGAANGGNSMSNPANVTITYPNGADTRNLTDRGPIQISIEYRVQGITPLYQLLGLQNSVTLRVTQRRSIENLGVDPSRPQGVACAKDLADLKALNGQP